MRQLSRKQIEAFEKLPNNRQDDLLAQIALVEARRLSGQFRKLLYSAERKLKRQGYTRSPRRTSGYAILVKMLKSYEKQEAAYVSNRAAFAAELKKERAHAARFL